MFDIICLSSFLEIHYLTCFLKAFKSPARFQLPGGGVVSTLLSLKMPFLEQKHPREVCIPALRAIPHPGNSTHHQRYIYGNKFK